jgi:hypothetical protein
MLRSELRWTPSPVVDMAVFFDQGTVAASTTALDLHDLKRGWGIGARLHGPTHTALRLEVVHDNRLQRASGRLARGWFAVIAAALVLPGCVAAINLR